MVNKKSLIHTMFFVIYVASMISAGTMSGTVTNNFDILLTDVMIRLNGLSSPSVEESAVTSSDGSYHIEGIPVGSYAVRLVKPMHDTKDTTILLGEDIATINFVMDSIVPLQGTQHSGEITDETWKPENNPHIIVDDIKITSTLYIAPGCTVTTKNGIVQVLNTLIIGNTTGARTIINDMHITPDTLSRTIILNNSNFNNLYYSHSYCNNLTIRNCAIAAISGNNFKPIAENMTIDSSTIAIIESGDIYLTAGENIKIINSQFSGARWWVGRVSISEMISTCSISGTSVTIYNSVFNPYMQVSAGTTAPPSQSFSNIDISYCRFHSLTTYRADKDTIPTNKISHCNIGTLTISGLQQDSVKNSIVGTLRHKDESKMRYSSAYLNNIIIDTIWYINIFGLLDNIRTNGNEDSCDLWFNMKADPLFTDSDSIVVGESSPAIGAASDGTNIGCYQGQGGVPPLHSISTPPVYLSAKTNTRYTSVLSLSGRSTFSTLSDPGYILLVNPMGRTVRTIRQKSITNGGKGLSSGVYFIKKISRR